MTVEFSLGGIVVAIGLTVTAEISPTRQRGAALAISVGLITTAGASPPTSGRIIQAARTPAAGFTQAFTIATALLLIGGRLAVIFIRPERVAAHTDPRHGQHAEPTCRRSTVGEHRAQLAALGGLTRHTQAVSGIAVDAQADHVGPHSCRADQPTSASPWWPPSMASAEEMWRRLAQCRSFALSGSSPLIR